MTAFYPEDDKRKSLLRLNLKFNYNHYYQIYSTRLLRLFSICR